MRPYYWFNEFSQHECDVRQGRKRGKHAVWRGPVAQTYFYADTPAIVLRITEPGNRYKISSLPSGWIGTALQGQDGTWTGEVPRSNRRLGTIYLTSPSSTVEEIEVRAREAHAADVASEAQVQADPLALIERELRGKDWYSHFSDDHSHWSAGEASDRRIQGIVSPLDDARKDQARALYAKYAPQDFACPF